MVTLTEGAAKELSRIIEQKSDQDKEKGEQPSKRYLRVGVKGGGCSGFSYTLDLADSVGEHDETFTQHGIDIVCDPKSFLYLEGTTVDFKDEIMGRGFVFNNPNATGTCGCGSSFSA